MLAAIGLGASAGKSADRPDVVVFDKAEKLEQTAASPSAFTTIVSGGILSKIYVGDDASFQVEHSSFPGIGQFYPAGSAAPADFGVFLRDKGTNTLYGHPVTTFTPNPSPWSPVSMSPVTGSGTSVDPYTVTVVSDAGSCFRLTMTVTYVSTEEFFRHRLSITNLCGQNRCFDLYVGSDIYLASSDAGLPVLAGNSVGGLNCPSQNYRILHIPVTPSAADNFVAAGYTTVWTEMVAGAPLSNTIQSSSCPGLDNGAALQWRNRCVDPGATITIDAATSFGQIPTVDPVGACCVGADCSIATEADCVAAGGFYWGDGTNCTPTSCWVQISGCKFNDLNGDGDWDQGEPSIPGVPITINTSPTPTTVLTNSPYGCFDFFVPAGTYTVRETVPQGMVQTAPSRVTFTGTFQPAAGYYVGDFGNEDTCVTTRQHRDTCLVGRMDNFATIDGAETAAPSAPLCALLQTCSNGPRNNCNPVPPNCSEFDCPGIDRCFGHTFTGCWDPTCTVIHARLNLRVRSVSGGNDGLGLYQDGVGVWGVSFSTLGTWPGDLTISLDLENLPPNALGVTNVLAMLQDGDLDVVIQDDTEVDFLELIVTTCCHCVEPPPDMVAWWPLDEIAGMAVLDIAGSVSDNGTPQPAPIGGGGPSSLPAVVSTGLSFPAGISPTPGPNVYVEVPPSSEVNFGTGDFSIDAWIELGPTADNIYPIVDNLDYSTPGQNKGYALFVQGGQLLLRLGPDNAGGLVGAVSTFASPMVLGQWYHVAVTVKRVSPNPLVTFYVDGLQNGPITPPGPGLSAGNNITTTTPLWIGGNSRLAGGGGTVSRGEISIDELEFFHRELTQLEVNSIWNADDLGKCKPCCDCPFQGDLNGDGFVDAVDLAILIDVVFFGTLDVQDPCCPITRGDFNGDGFVDAVDLAIMIDYVFFGGSGPVNPC